MARIAELEEAANHDRSRAKKFESEKNKLIVEIRDITIELDKVGVTINLE